MHDKVTAAALARELRMAGSSARAAGAARYFKTGPGEYGEGDVFLGVTVPELRKIVRRYRTLELVQIEELLRSKEHECRAAALLILVAQYAKADVKGQREILQLYLSNSRYINNWDLVDCSCREIVGDQVRMGQKGLLTRLARSESLWERRIAMISTMPLVRTGELAEALRIAEMLLDDSHDLIHKAVGWVLRELGDRDKSTLVAFLERHYLRVPRTALRYAIEHFPSEERQRVLRNEFSFRATSER